LQIGKQFVVSTHVDHQLNNSKTELFWELLANPAGKDGLHAQNLQQLISDYPQSNILHALLVNTSEGENLKTAAAYANPKVLYKLTHDTADLSVVSSEQIIKVSKAPAAHNVQAEKPEEEFLLAPWVEEDDLSVDEEHHITPVENDTYAEEHELVNEVEDLPALTEQQDSVLEYIPYSEIAVDEPESTIVHEEAASVEEENIVEPLIELEPDHIDAFQPIDDEVYEEIVSIDDINLANENIFVQPKEEQHDTPVEEVAAPVESELAEPEARVAEPVKEEAPTHADRTVNLNDEADKLILNNIVSTDFFVFDRSFQHKETAEEISEPEAAPIESPTIVEVKQPYKTVSKYNDEKMPYSFMWWLDKTRKEHSGIYQPFVEFKLDTTQTIKQNTNDELQHQYYENIFHLTSVEELERGTTEQPVSFDPNVKEDKIIERFIQEVPQIKPQTGDKLDNENKAKKSSEDQAELVTETLAQVYIDQMLYPKAIATYKKLILKFPEKSRYFASQIEQLEKKTN
jgi:hypothetical protein